MVSNVTSLTGNGLKDWLIQRVTAVYFFMYSFFLLGFFITHTPLSYDVWHGLFQTPWFQVASVLALVTLSLHVWIGVWTVSTDYIQCTAVRLLVQLLVAGLLAGQFIWGLMIVWGQ